MDAVKAVLTNYVGFSGRARRSEYWWFVLFQVIVNVVFTVIGNVIGFAQLPNLVALALLLPGLGVAIRRMHDIGKSGWWVLINLIPIVGWIVFIVWAAKDSQPGANAYGPNPKESVGGAAPAMPAV
ncbi:MAG TPA: DUF805 domain-containing protein [Anaeromyxobacter sp.]|nr:DUF805 domain-containing protein [Anaeromyxobacter sp.]